MPRLALWVPAPPGDQADAIELNPDRDPPWSWVERAVRAACGMRAPKKLLAQLPPVPRA